MEDLVKVPRVVKKTGLATSTVYLLVKENRIPHIRFGQSIRFSETKIDEWIESQLREPVASQGQE